MSFELKRSLLAICPEFNKIDVNILAKEYPKIWEKSKEELFYAVDKSDVGGLAPANKAAGQLKYLSQFAQDLTARARENKIDKVLGRDKEIRQIINILLRRRQNNPILVGEPGVGKTAIVEGLAQKIINKDVPPILENVQIYMLDVGLLKAGASMKGEFEQRLRSVISEVENSLTKIILFIDEAHTLIGSGGTPGTGDAANLLKPALARGTLRTIAATTWSKYR